MENKYKNIIDRKNQYFENFDKINERRMLWNTKIKDTISLKLNEINKEIKDLVWFVAKNENVKNLESVYLSMGNEPAGLKYKNKLITRGPGYLNFAQLITGEVVVIISYPYVEDGFRDKIAPKEIGIFEPQNIDENRIIECVEIFIDEINKWMMNINYGGNTTANKT